LCWNFSRTAPFPSLCIEMIRLEATSGLLFYFSNYFSLALEFAPVPFLPPPETVEKNLRKGDLIVPPFQRSWFLSFPLFRAPGTEKAKSFTILLEYESVLPEPPSLFLCCPSSEHTPSGSQIPALPVRRSINCPLSFFCASFFAETTLRISAVSQVPPSLKEEDNMNMKNFFFFPLLTSFLLLFPSHGGNPNGAAPIPYEGWHRQKSRQSVFFPL